MKNNKYVLLLGVIASTLILTAIKNRKDRTYKDKEFLSSFGEDLLDKGISSLQVTSENTTLDIFKSVTGIDLSDTTEKKLFIFLLKDILDTANIYKRL